MADPIYFGKCCRYWPLTFGARVGRCGFCGKHPEFAPEMTMEEYLRRRSTPGSEGSPECAHQWDGFLGTPSCGERKCSKCGRLELPGQYTSADLGPGPLDP